MSKGPILLEEDSIESVGKAEINKLEINIMTDNGKKTVIWVNLRNGRAKTWNISALEF